MGLLVGELAKRAKVNIQTVKYYERRRLLLPPTRKDSGYRLYDEESLRKLRFIRQAQDLGFSLAEIEDLLRLRSSASPSKCSKVMAKAEKKLKEVSEKIAQLSKMAEVLKDLITDCRNRKPSESCSILDCCEGV